MAIDTTIYAADIPAGTYTAGQIIPLVNIAGPANVRSGRGDAFLKAIFTGCVIDTGSYPAFRVHVKNSDWVDEVASMPSSLASADTAFDPDSGQYQDGHNCKLTANSGWQVYAEVITTSVTSTAAMSIFALIDVDYPQVSAVQDPRKAVGFPTSINYDRLATVNAAGAMTSATWQIDSVDYFKAGFQYCLDKVEAAAPTSAQALLAFVAFANAAGMGGLQRIVPLNMNTEAIRYPIKYASTLEKGPMDIKLMVFGASAGTATISMAHDYIKR